MSFAHQTHTDDILDEIKKFIRGEIRTEEPSAYKPAVVYLSAFTFSLLILLIFGNSL